VISAAAAPLSIRISISLNAVQGAIQALPAHLQERLMALLSFVRINRNWRRIATKPIASLVTRQLSTE
jgi:hypothetical protein